jgi:carbon storage regulator
MLILTRRIGETLMIGDTVTVTVLGTKGQQVRVGINAPRNMRVDRKEVRARMESDLASGTIEPVEEMPMRAR